MNASRLYQAEGLILKHRNFRETDRIVTVFTRQYGKITLMAKGVRRITSRRSGHIQAFRHVRLFIRHEITFDILTEAQMISDFGLSTAPLTKISYAYYLAELIDQLTAENQKLEEVFPVVLDAFERLSISDDNQKLIATVGEFANTLLKVLGFLADTKTLNPAEITPYVESITEKYLRTPRIMRAMHRT